MMQNYKKISSYIDRLQQLQSKKKYYENTNSHHSNLSIVNCFSYCPMQNKSNFGQKSKRNIQKQNKMSKKLINKEQIIKVALIIAMFAFAAICAIIR